MHQKQTKYYAGLEFYRKSEGNTCGVVNDEEGTQSVYMHLSDEEVLAWTAAWLKGEPWVRKYGMLAELLESA